MAIYFTALSIMPCTDGISQIETHTSSEVSVSDNHHDHSHNEEDGCTPFCVCACCGTIVVMPSIFQIGMRRIDLTSTYQFSYTFDYSFDYNEGIWHPPAIS